MNLRKVTITSVTTSHTRNKIAGPIDNLVQDAIVARQPPIFKAAMITQAFTNPNHLVQKNILTFSSPFSNVYEVFLKAMMLAIYLKIQNVNKKIPTMRCSSEEYFVS